MISIAIATSKSALPAGDQALAVALAEQGFDVHPVIWSSPQQEWRKFDVVVVRSCWDYHLRTEEFLGWIALLERHGVAVLNPPDLIRWNVDKNYLAELAAAGIPVPETIFVDPGTEVDLTTVCISHDWPSAVVKPTISASAYCTERRRTGLVRGPAMVQQYIAAIESEGEWSLVYINGEFSHAVIKKPRDGDFRVQNNFGGTVRLAQPSNEMTEFAEAVLSRLAWPAIFARVDIVCDGPSTLLMELEVIEPELFLDLVPGSSRRLATSIRDYLFQMRTSQSGAPGTKDLTPTRVGRR
jgi:glutathione synthase/RimK-type ligase-like ATP-grasp enzyme